MDNIDINLMRAVQADLPLVHEPFAAIAAEIGISAEEVLMRLQILLDTGHIKRIGGMFNSKKLGYCGTLCGMKVSDERITEVAAILDAYPGITHNYLREDDAFNMWFTLQAEGRESLLLILDIIHEQTGINEIIELPSRKSYKIRVKFNLDNSMLAGGIRDDM